MAPTTPEEHEFEATLLARSISRQIDGIIADLQELKSRLESFGLDGMTLRPCYNSQIDEIGGCLDETDEFQACDDCVYRGKCPMQGDEE